MRLQLSVTDGFVTNSSSVVHCFDPAVLKDRAVSRLLKAIGYSPNLYKSRDDVLRLKGEFIGPNPSLDDVKEMMSIVPELDAVYVCGHSSDIYDSGSLTGKLVDSMVKASKKLKLRHSCGHP